MGRHTANGRHPSALQAEIRAKMGLKPGEAPPAPPPAPKPQAQPKKMVTSDSVVSAPKPAELSLRDKLETFPDGDLATLASLNGVDVEDKSRADVLDALVELNVEV